MEFLPFFLILIVGILFSAAFRRFHLPWVLALIVAGIAIGPYTFNLLEVTPTIAFIGEIGLIFLMFMAGLETRLSSFREFRKGIAVLAILSTTIPFGVGFLIASYFGFSTIATFLLGIIFMSSSVAVIIPTLEASGRIDTRLGRTIVSSAVLADIASLLALSVVLQSTNQVTALPLPSFYLLLFATIAALLFILPKVRNLIPHPRDENDLFESEVRIVFAMLLGVVVIFELLGLHPIIAGFFTGLVLSDSIKSKVTIEKLRTLSYGIFIPVFFIVVGMNTDISVFADKSLTVGLVSIILAGSMLAKFFSGWIGARIIGFSGADAFRVGFAIMPHLSTALAVAFTAVELGILRVELITAMVILSIVTTIVSPLALQYIDETRKNA